MAGDDLALEFDEDVMRSVIGMGLPDLPVPTPPEKVKEEENPKDKVGAGDEFGEDFFLSDAIKYAERMVIFHTRNDPDPKLRFLHKKYLNMMRVAQNNKNLLERDITPSVRPVPSARRFRGKSGFSFPKISMDRITLLRLACVGVLAYVAYRLFW